jgi:hypothetical protein
MLRIRIFKIERQIKFKKRLKLLNSLNFENFDSDF